MNNRIETVFNKYNEEEFMITGLRLCFISTKKHPMCGLMYYFKINDDITKSEQFISIIDSYGPFWTSDSGENMIRVKYNPDIKLNKHSNYDCNIKLVVVHQKGVIGKAYNAIIISATPSLNTSSEDADPFAD